MNYDHPFIKHLQACGLHQDAACIVRLGDELDTELTKMKAGLARTRERGELDDHTSMKGGER